MFHYDERRNYEALHGWLSPALEQFNGVIVTDEHKSYHDGSSCKQLGSFGKYFCVCHISVTGGDLCACLLYTSPSPRDS